MTTKILLPRRFWVFLGLTGVWGILGGAAMGFLIGVPAAAAFLLAVAGVLIFVTFSSRFVKDREYSLGQGIAYLFAGPLMFFALLPLGVGLILGNALIWQVFLGVFVMLFLLSTVEFVRAARSTR